VAGGRRPPSRRGFDKNFADALAFTNRIGAIADQQNHHPDIELGWGKVRVKTWSHDAGRITARDFRLAGAIDQEAVR
jgi:4a-hydroxytetrahydrobiopterin dehydratase